MFKLRVLKAIAFAVLIAFTTQCISSANPDIFTRNARMDTDTLAPELYLQKRGIEMQSLMFLADITGQALRTGVKSDKLPDFIRSAETITPEIAGRIDFDNTTISGDKVRVGYRGTKGVSILTFGLIPEHVKGRIPPAENRIQIANMIVEIRSPFSHLSDDETGPAEGIPGQDDITGAAESNIAAHEAGKEFRTPLKGFFGRLLKHWGKWKEKGERGINDVIRDFWKDGRPGKGCELCGEMPAILRFLYNNPDGSSIGESILANGYKVYIYDTGKTDFTKGITTHYGIRTGSIHITKKEYDRLKAMGIGHLAARIAHEVSEIDSWRQKAGELIAERKIDDLGVVSGIYNEKWANGIRKWIRDNCEGSGRGYAQNLDREFHRKGVEKEAAIIASGMLDQGAGDAEEYFKAVMQSVREFRSGRHAGLVKDPYAAHTSGGGIFSGIFESISRSLKQLSSEKDRGFFLNILYARASLGYARSLNGGLEVSLAGQKDQSLRSKDILHRLTILRDSLNGIEVMDSATREYAERWIEEAEAKIKDLSSKAQETFATVLVALKKQISQKHRATGWEDPYASDPGDIIGASSGGQADPGFEEDGDEEIILHTDTTSGGIGRAAGLGEVVKPEVAEAIKPQSKPITRSLEVDSIINIITLYNNWGYRDLMGRSKSTVSETKPAKDTTKGAVAKTTNYIHIKRFPDERTFRQRVGAAARSAMHLVNNPEVLKLTNGSRNFRVFFGSPSGYFDTIDTKKDYAHQIEITILVDGEHKLEDFTYGPLSKEMAEVLDEFKPQNPEEAEYLPPVRGIKLNIVGLDTVKKAFRGLQGAQRSKKEIAWRKELQRLFIKLYREDIQVTGSNLVDENKEFSEAFPIYEHQYIEELVDQLDRIVREKQEALEEKSKITLTELSADDERKLAEIKASLSDDDAKLAAFREEKQSIAKRKAESEAKHRREQESIARRKAKLETKHKQDLESIAQRRAELEQEQQNLLEVHQYLQDYQKRREAGDVVLAEETQTYGENLRKYKAQLETWKGRHEEVTKDEAMEYEAWQRSLAEITAAESEENEAWQKILEGVTKDEGRVDGSLQALEPNMERKLKAVQALETRKSRAERMRKAFEFQSQNLDRHYELLCKRIEDAQFGHPLTSGVVISNRYRVMEKLGEGGFGEVYRVFDRELGQEKAIKIMKPTQHMPLADKDRALRSFDRELKSMMDLRGAGAQVPYVEGKGVYAGSQFFVMSLVRGLTLQEIIDKDRRGEIQLSLRDKLVLMYALAKTLARFHVAKFIHRDIKPSNIMIPVNEDGSLAIEVKDDEKLDPAKLLKSSGFDTFVIKIMIIDLGQTVPGEMGDRKETDDFKVIEDRTDVTGKDKVPGTPYYMAPEQAAPSENNKPGSKTDVYAMGVIFYRLLTHRHPRGEGLSEGMEVIQSHFSDDPISWLCAKIERENAVLKRKREEDRRVNVRQLDAIKEDLVAKLVREAKSDRRLFDLNTIGKDKTLLWREDVVKDEASFVQRLRNISWLTDTERDKIRGVVIRRLPQTDGFIEAIVHQMLKRNKSERPTANQVAAEIEKYLTGDNENMIYRPRGEKRQKGYLVRAAGWFQTHVMLFVFFAGLVVTTLVALLIGVYKLYHDAISERAIALRETKQALEAKNEAERAVKDAQEKMRQLEEERRKINESLEVLKKERGTVEEQKKSLSEQVQALSEKAKRALELEEKLKEMEERVKQLNEQELKLKEKEEELNRRIKESEENLRRAEAELAKRRGTLAGVLEDARAAAQKFDARTAYDTIDRKLFWWAIDNSTLKKYTLGIDEISKIMTDNGQIDEALRLEKDRIAILSRLIGFQETEEAKLPYQEELVRAQLAVMKLHQMKGSYAEAERYAQQLMEMQAYKDSKERMEALRVSLIGVLLEGAVNAGNDDTRKTYLAKVEEHVKLLESENGRNLYYGYLYTLKGDHRNAVKYFGYYHDQWAKQAAEEGIAAGVKAQREREAATALLLSAVAYRQQAAGYKAEGKDASIKGACDYAQAYLDRIAREYAKQKEVLAWAEFIKGELLALQGETEKAAEAYKKTAAEAEANKLKLLLILARSRTGAEINLADLIDTWTELVAGKIPVPLPYVEELKKLLRKESSRHQEQAEEAKRKAEEEARKAAEEKRKAEEAAKRQAEEAALREQVLKGLKTAQDAKVKLIQVNKEIQTLTGQVGLERDRGKRASMEKQLERARKEKAILEGFIEDKRKEAPGEEKPAEEEDKGAGRSEKKKDGIGSSILDAPDERLVDALIECAFEDYLFSQVETNGIREVFLGTDTCRTFYDIYTKLTMKEQRLKAKFEELCEADDVPGMAIAKIYSEDLEKLRNIAGHAGRFTKRRPDVNVPSIYIARGYIDRDTLINHERMELFIHLQEAARRQGYMSWDTIPDEKTRSRAVYSLENAEDYGEFVLRAHLMANEQFKVSDEDELIPDKKKQDGVLDVAAHYRRMPIAAEQEGETPKPVFELSIFLQTISKIAGRLASAMSVKTDPFMGSGKTEADKKGVIIYADDIMDCSAVFDLNKLAEIAGSKDGAIGTVVLYARDQRKADIVRKMIMDADAKANVMVVTEEDIKSHYGKDYYTIDQSQTEMLLRYLTNRKSGIFPNSDRILGLVRGPLRNGEDKETLKKELIELKVPAVIFENDRKGSVYSVMQALSRLMEARSSGKDLADELLIVLPPITRVSEALQKEYQIYRAMMQALESAA